MPDIKQDNVKETASSRALGQAGLGEVQGGRRVSVDATDKRDKGTHVTPPAVVK